VSAYLPFQEIATSEESGVTRVRTPEHRSSEVDHIHRSGKTHGALSITSGTKYFRGEMNWSIQNP
jgi:hypothetical protein